MYLERWILEDKSDSLQNLAFALLHHDIQTK